jgi:hypothetical protein
MMIKTFDTLVFSLEKRVGEISSIYNLVTAKLGFKCVV